MEIFAVDVGSVAKHRFGWAHASYEAGQPDLLVTGDGDIQVLVEALATALDDGQAVTLGFECPLFVPITEDPNLLTSPRHGEGNRPWSAGAGATSLAAGLTETAWVLHGLRRAVRQPFKTYLDWRSFERARSGLFLWEAFVTGDAKGDVHLDDAQISVKTFADAMPNPEAKNAIQPERVLSLIGAALMWSGCADPADGLLSKPVLVLKA